jgi:hypothetical protein
VAVFAPVLSFCCLVVSPALSPLARHGAIARPLFREAWDPTANALAKKRVPAKTALSDATPRGPQRRGDAATPAAAGPRDARAIRDDVAARNAQTDAQIDAIGQEMAAQVGEHPNLRRRPSHVTICAEQLDVICASLSFFDFGGGEVGRRDALTRLLLRRREGAERAAARPSSSARRARGVAPRRVRRPHV